jgi:hypothetical protein
MCDAARPDGSLYVPYLAIETPLDNRPLFSVKYIPLPADVNWGPSGPADNDGRAEQKHGHD